MRSTPLRFLVEGLWNILLKKCGISNQPVAASAMIRVFPSLDHSSGACPHPVRQFVGLLCSTYLCCQKVRPLSPVCRTCAHQVSKRGRDTEPDAVIRLEEIHTFFSNECSRCSSIRNLYHVLLIIVLTAKRDGTLKAAGP